MEVLGVADAAARLGVSPQALYQLLDSGRVSGLNVAGRLALPIEEVRRLERLPRPTGRPFSARSAWVIIGMLSGTPEPVGVSPSRRSKMRRHLLTMGTEELVGRLRGRADRTSFYVHRGLLEKALNDPELLPTGERAASAFRGLNLVGDASHGEAYVRASLLPRVKGRYHLSSSEDVANLTVRVVSEDAEGLVDWRRPTAPEAAVSLDLVEAFHARANSAGWGRLRELHDEYKTAAGREEAGHG